MGGKAADDFSGQWWYLWTVPFTSFNVLLSFPAGLKPRDDFSTSLKDTCWVSFHPFIRRDQQGGWKAGARTGGRWRPLGTALHWRCWERFEQMLCRHLDRKWEKSLSGKILTKHQFVKLIEQSRCIYEMCVKTFCFNLDILPKLAKTKLALRLASQWQT